VGFRLLCKEPNLYIGFVVNKRIAAKECAVFLAAIVLLTTACSQSSSSPPNIPAQPLAGPTASPESELRPHVGKLVTLHGKFSLSGKLGPFIVVGNEPVYIISRGNFSWGKEYDRMEGKDVRVTGTLGFYSAPPVTPGPVAEARAPDHFYFEAQSAKIELNEK
jgi:hypothetical protein